MKLSDRLGQLTYCLNIHATQTWDEVRAALTGPVAAVKAAVCPDDDFAVGLRFSGEALEELSNPGKRQELKDILASYGYLGLTVNGFPYGRFHDARVKSDVYQPDWRLPERLCYTNALADLMAEIAPRGEMTGETISLSTVPGTFRPLGDGAGALIAQNYLACVAHLVDLRARTGVTIALAIEPEPFCFLETIAETVVFFDSHLFSESAIAWLAQRSGLTRAEAAAALPRHLGLCYDVCHAAVEYEDPGASIAALTRAGIPVHKLQLSAALRIPEIGAPQRRALAGFVEPTYLHQVIRRTPAGLVRHADLPEALALGSISDGEEWRVHFHVPIFIDDLGAFASTRDFLEEILALHRQAPISPHLEIETYTWDVLPEALRGASVDHDIIREINWVRGKLQP